MTLSRSTLHFALILSLSLVVMASSKEKEAPGKRVDSGSFGVFMNGSRVGTETFTITQNNNGSVIQSEFKAEGSAGAALQDSEMQLTSSGEIRRYEWKERSPGKAEYTVLPNDQFLVQKSIAAPGEKEQDHPYLLAVTTSILDDYFFVHREVLAWKYLGTACSHEKEGMRCPKAQFGTMNPRQQNSAPATLEYLGRDKVAIRGAEKELNKLELKSDTGSWILWLDEQFKVLKMSIPAEKTEVIRD